MRRISYLTVPVICLCLSAVEPVAAADEGAAGLAAGIDSTLGAKPIASESLAAERGGTNDTLVSGLEGSLSQDRATNTVSGGNVIQSGAFANASGLPTVIQNSGNNVLIQNSTIVNVQFK
jgi:hypothetical protein